MRKALALVLCLTAVALVPTEARAEDAYRGTITSTGTSVTNGTTGVTFTLTSSSLDKVALQCDAAAYIRVVEASSDTVSSSTGVKLAADQLYDMTLPAGARFIAVISVSGTANCKTFIRRG